MIRIQLYKSLLAASGHIALEVDIEVKKNAFVAIHGPSGSGKTTLLRLIAGLLKPEKGYINIEGEIWLDTNRKIFVPPQQRNIGLVFQDYALFPNMSVRENLNFALKKNQSPKIVDELMEMSELTGLAQRRPQQLSGGQQQRVALARALVQQPTILLMDEPLSALDPEMRAHLQDYIRKTHQTFNLTTILVSHDVNEIVRMADRVLLLENGQIKQSGSAEEVLLEKTAGERFQLTGTIYEIYTKEGTLHGKINIGAETIEIPLTSIDASQLNVGDKVILSASTQESRVTKA